MYKAKICMYFKGIHLGLRHSPTHMRKSRRPLKSAEKRFLMYGFCSNKDGDGPRKYTLRRLQAIHRRHLSKGQILRGVQLMECLPVGMFIG